MQYAATKKVATFCAAYIVMGAVAGAIVPSSDMAGAGVVAMLVCTPVALLIDWWRSRKRGLGASRDPQLLLSPPE